MLHEPQPVRDSSALKTMALAGGVGRGEEAGGAAGVTGAEGGAGSGGVVGVAGVLGMDGSVGAIGGVGVVDVPGSAGVAGEAGVDVPPVFAGVPGVLVLLLVFSAPGALLDDLGALCMLQPAIRSAAQSAAHRRRLRNPFTRTTRQARAAGGAPAGSPHA